MITEMTLEEWRAKGSQLFGENTENWRFVCPSCNHVASVADWKNAGAPEGTVAFSCVGRYLDKSRQAFGKDPGPCNYAGGGLIRLNPVLVSDGEQSHYMFAFDEGDQK